MTLLHDERRVLQLPMTLLLLVVVVSGAVVRAGVVKPTTSLGQRLGCGGHDPSGCLTDKLTDMLHLGRLYLVTVTKLKHGGVGTVQNVSGISFRAQSKGPLSLSGSGISVVGLESAHVKQVKLNENDVQMILAVPKLNVKGDFLIQFTPLKHKFYIDLKIVNLELIVTATFGNSKILTVDKVLVSMTAEKMQVAIIDNELLNKLLSEWVNNTKILNSKTLPWLAKIMGRKLKKILQKYVAQIKQ